MNNTMRKENFECAEDVMNALAQYTGTEGYHIMNPFTRLLGTDGIVALASKVGCFWLFDEIAFKLTNKIRAEYSKTGNFFYIVKVKISSTQKSWSVDVYSDYDSSISKKENKKYRVCGYRQDQLRTDMPRGEYKFYYYANENLIILPQEY